MDIKSAISALFSVGGTVRDLQVKIDKKNADIAELHAQPPHLDDIVAWMRRGVDAHAAELALRHLSLHE